MPKKKNSKPAQNRQAIMEKVTDLILDEMKKGNLPWEKGWVGGGLHHNITTPNKPYRGINQFSLPAWCIQHGWTSNSWGTFKQWKEYALRYAKKNKLYELDDNGNAILGKDGEPKLQWLGIQKGQSSEAVVVFWKLILVDEKDKEGNPVVDANGKQQKKRIPLLKWFNIFNRDQTGLPPVDKDKEPLPLDDREEAFTDTLNSYMEREDLRFDEGSDRAAYSQSFDRIIMPARDQFDDVGFWLSTWSHECIHSTGHMKRLNRKMGGTFGDKQYAREELIAEMVAAMLCQLHGWEYETINRSAAYLQNWIKVLNDDKKLLIVAGTQASKAVDYIMDDGSGDEEE